MEKIKRSVKELIDHNEPRDRLSELPDLLIFDIFWLLPMRDVVRTTVLSRRWKNLWTTATCLNFRDCMGGIATDRVRNFINRALMFWKGIKILKFKIDFGYHLEKSLFSDIDLWVRFAKEYEVEELYVDLIYDDDIIGNDFDATKGTQEEMYWAPQCLYSCSSLKELYLDGCNLQIHGNVHWYQLKSLTIYGFGVTEHVIKQVLSGSPKLEVFFLCLMENFENLSIQSSSLKVLSIEKYLYYEDDVPSMDTELKIWTPNLEILEFKRVPYSKCSLMNVSSLTVAFLGFDGRDLFPGETLSQILPAIQHVEQVILWDWCIKVIGAMKSKCLLTPLSNVKHLKLNYCRFKEHKQIVGVLEIFPNLKTLVIKHKKVDKKFDAHQHSRESLKFETNLPNSFLLQLRTVQITWDDEAENLIFPFMKIVLKYARNLEKMVFRLEGTVPSNSLFLASQKLLRMPRSSPTAEFIFCVS